MAEDETGPGKPPDTKQQRVVDLRQPDASLTVAGVEKQSELNLPEELKTDKTRVKELPQHSSEWAGVVKPFSWAVIVLLFLLMVIPFVLIWHFSSQVQINIPAGTKPEEVAAMIKAAHAATEAQDIKEMLDWAKTFLPSLVGFATAMIGYYFGIRSGTSGQGQAQGSSDQESDT